VEALRLVVNFDVPQLLEDYIHPVGRTARDEAAIQHWRTVRWSHLRVRDVASYVSSAKEGLVVLPGAGKERTEGHVPQEDVFEALGRETVPVTA